MGKIETDCKLCDQYQESESSSCPTCCFTKSHDDPEDSSTGDEIMSEIHFPGPAIVKRNSAYGNYVVASRTINAGEVICSEKPLLVSAYGPADIIPLCLTCGKDIGLSSKCSKCKWSVCDPLCEQNALHADNECEIFRRNGVRQKCKQNEFFSIETLRGLLLREKYPKKWAQLMKFEAHVESRNVATSAMETRNFIVDFIRNKCKLTEYDEKIIDQVVGVLSVNTFGGYDEINRHFSILFDKVTLLAHDCDPNTTRTMTLALCKEGKNDEEDCYSQSGIHMEIIASRTINPGEMITIQYTNVNQPVKVRRETLKELFYFDCFCSKCLSQLLDDNLNIDTDILNNNPILSKVETENTNSI